MFEKFDQHGPTMHLFFGRRGLGGAGVDQRSNCGGILRDTNSLDCVLFAGCGQWLARNCKNHRRHVPGREKHIGIFNGVKQKGRLRDEKLKNEPIQETRKGWNDCQKI